MALLGLLLVGLYFGVLLGLGVLLGYGVYALYEHVNAWLGWLVGLACWVVLWTATRVTVRTARDGRKALRANRAGGFAGFEPQYISLMARDVMTARMVAWSWESG